MNPNDLLRQVTIPSPCPATWESMTGDDRIRTCAECGKEVHNFEALTAEEAASLVAARGDSLCGQIRRRKDGSIVTLHEDSAPKGPKSGLKFHLRSLMAAIAGIAAALGLARYFFNQTETVAGALRVVPPPASCGTTLRGRVAALPPSASSSTAMLGEIAALPPSSTTASCPPNGGP